MLHRGLGRTRRDGVPPDVMKRLLQLYLGSAGRSTILRHELTEVLGVLRDAKVDVVDMLGVRDRPRNFLDPAPIDLPYDFDRNGRVNATDMLIARNHPTHLLNALRLITVPPAAKDAVLLSVRGEDRGTTGGARIEGRGMRSEG